MPAETRIEDAIERPILEGRLMDAIRITHVATRAMQNAVVETGVKTLKSIWKQDQ